ncbi:MAG: protein TolR [Pseudomonadota bacterium]|nr:protein TolR [Pseudomonadota bacterium]
MVGGRSSGGAGYRAKRFGAYQPMSEINVTPMVDVMLVLLVVFMITAPLLTVGVPVDLPKTKASRVVGQDEPLVISVNAKGKLFIQDTEIALGALAARLRAITSNKQETRIFVRGDKQIAYGQVMDVMGAVHWAGFRRVALITEMPDRRSAGKKTGKHGAR